MIKNENTYKYQYNGECLEECPPDTKLDTNCRNILYLEF